MKVMNAKENEIYEPTLDIVITARDRDEYDIVERLKIRKNYNLPSNCNFLVVDYGSSLEVSLELESVCKEYGYRYIFEDARLKPFNNSKARNIAILNSEADYILFEDIDLASHVDFYHWIITQIKSMIIERNWPFLVIPVSYLSESASTDMYSTIDDFKYDQILSEIFDDESEMIDFHAAASSHMVCSRKMAQFIGGFDESFEGWGFEDSDFWLRYLRKVSFEKPREFYKLDTRPYTNQTQWRGWRALFRIFADVMANKGIYSFHIWHEKAEHRSDEIRQRNHRIFLQNSERYAKTKWELEPLHNPKKPTDLFLNENPHSFNISVFHHFDNPLLLRESNINVDKLDEYIERFNIRNVIFNNPYGNPKRQVIYEKIKELQVPVYVVERGALPNSIYVDNNGFCAESESYNEIMWQDSLTEDKREITRNYINDYKAKPVSLESQKSGIMGGSNLRYKLGVGAKDTKIMFVALQSPSDTTTNFFSGSIQSYDNFINEMQKVCYFLEDKGWKVLYKNHPLTLDKVKLDNAICVDDFHINDILEACDCVSLINSGVGVLAMLYNKPVYYFGEAFYAVEGLNKKIANADELSSELESFDFEYDESKAIGFISFLINDFYSFATWKRVERNHTNKAKMSISQDIVYDVLRIKGYEYRFNNQPAIDLRKSFLFDRYRLEDYLYRDQSSSTKPVQSKTDSTEFSKKINTIEKKVDNIERLNKVDATNKKYNIKTKTNKLINNPNQFFADFFLKRM